VPDIVDKGVFPRGLNYEQTNVDTNDSQATARKSTKTPFLRKYKNETAENRVTNPFRNTQSQTLFPVVGSGVNYLH
jgi:hypothetical protein